MFSLIAAIDSNSGIAKDGSIPWYCPEDLNHFKEMTTGHVVIMGRLTWESLPSKFRPLPHRINVVISGNGLVKADHTQMYPNFVFSTIDQVIDHFNINKKQYANQKLFVIGGSSIYNQFFERNLIADVHLTMIKCDYMCDQFINFPEMIGVEERTLCGNDDVIYRRYFTINHEENQFLHVMADIINHGVVRDDRTGAGTKSIFSRELRFDLSKGRIPMMTTRPVGLRYVFEELMWILRGQTDNKILNDKKIHIWDDNTTRKFLDNKHLNHLPVGDIGPSYGFQMRHFGSNYLDCKTGYTSGFDQLKYVIHLLKTNPTSRRIIINLWNPNQLDQMALPPCMYGYQFYVANGQLSCKLIQRSSDIALAGSHNCTAGALLVRMLCKVTGLVPGELIWSPSDIHIYLNQTESVMEQLGRCPKPFPTLKVVGSPKNNDILNFEYKHFKLLNYAPWPKIKFAMNA